MNKTIIATIITLTALVIISFAVYPKMKQSHIKSAIEEANYCDIDSDCIDAGGKCPFGCYVYVNKDEVDEIARLISSYDSKCVYGCVFCQSVICENHNCKEVCE